MTARSKPTPEVETPKRRYDSARRRQQAAEKRAAVVQAAARLFAERGWAATGMRDIATAAGVAIETVYTNFASKAELLSAAIDMAVVGDTEQVPLADRAEFQALADGDLAGRARAAARLNVGIARRVSPLHRAFVHAAESDAALATRLGQDEERRRLSVQQAAELVAARPLRAEEVDGLWALASVEVFHLLTAVRGWSHEQYEEWLADLLVRLFAT